MLGHRGTLFPTANKQPNVHARTTGSRSMFSSLLARFLARRTRRASTSVLGPDPRPKMRSRGRAMPVVAFYEGVR